MENTDLTPLEKELEKRAEGRIKQVLHKVMMILNSDVDGLAIFGNNARLRPHVYIRKDEQYVAIPLIELFSYTGKKHGNQIIRNALPIFIEKEKNKAMEAFGKLNNPVKQANSSTENEQIIENAISGHIKKLKSRLAEKKKQREYLVDFLNKVYKGSDVKQKIEKELICIDREIEELRFCIPTEQDLPF